jgi:5-methylcytosine-specific restriction endonuclease McrA
MATHPLKPCRHAGCLKLVRGGGYCDRHQQEHHRTQDARRGTPAERGYGRGWQQIRRMVLRERPACERCGDRAVLVHHRDHISTNNARSNLESLCRRCHEREHPGKGGPRG